jgi:hypothetical protein
MYQSRMAWKLAHTEMGAILIFIPWQSAIFSMIAKNLLSFVACTNSLIGQVREQYIASQHDVLRIQIRNYHKNPQNRGVVIDHIMRERRPGCSDMVVADIIAGHATVEFPAASGPLIIREPVSIKCDMFIGASPHILIPSTHTRTSTLIEYILTGNVGVSYILVIFLQCTNTSMAVLYYVGSPDDVHSVPYRISYLTVVWHWQPTASVWPVYPAPSTGLSVSMLLEKHSTHSTHLTF